MFLAVELRQWFSPPIQTSTESENLSQARDLIFEQLYDIKDHFIPAAISLPAVAVTQW